MHVFLQELWELLLSSAQHCHHSLPPLPCKQGSSSVRAFPELTTGMHPATVWSAPNAIVLYAWFSIWGRSGNARRWGLAGGGTAWGWDSGIICPWLLPVLIAVSCLWWWRLHSPGLLCHDEQNSSETITKWINPSVKYQITKMRKVAHAFVITKDKIVLPQYRKTWKKLT